MAPLRTISMFFVNGASDKEYHVTIERVEPGDSGFAVNFAYGRRGTTLNTGTKTTSPTTLYSANQIFDKLVKSKQAKGYAVSLGTEAPNFSVSDNAGEASTIGTLPQLLNPIEESELKELIWDDEWAMQEKKDGKRIMVKIEDGVVEGSNRRGLVVSLPDAVVNSLKNLPSCKLDGELVGEIYYVFDMLKCQGKYDCYRFGDRHMALVLLLEKKLGPNAKIVPSYHGGVKKEEMFEKFKAANAEGVVFKKLDSSYEPGRPNSGGSQLKYKFYDTCSAIVTKINQQRSVGLSMHDGTEIGNVTILPNFDVPRIGDIVEVRYLYYNKGGALYQPCYLGARDDMSPEDCSMDQLKEKGE